MAKIKSVHPRSISIEIYHEMWEAYCIEQTVDYVAKKVGVEYKTARKYIEKGDSKRGLDPIAKRFAKTMRQAQRKEEYDLAQANRQSLQVVRAYKAVIAKHIKSMSDTGAKVKGDVANQLDKIARLEQFLMGEPDSRQEVVGDDLLKLIADLIRQRYGEREAVEFAEALQEATIAAQHKASCDAGEVLH